MKRACLIIMIAFTFGLYSLASALERDKHGIPLPQNAQFIGAHAIELGSGRHEVSVYNCDMPAEGILDFFRKQLPKYGWQENVKFLEAARKMPLPENEHKESARRYLGNMTQFYKQDYELTVGVLPNRSYQRSTFSIGYGKKIDVEGMDFSAVKPMDFAPLCPGAKMLFANKNNYVYQIPDIGIEAAVAFYKTNMANYGWKLDEELLPEEYEIADDFSTAITKAESECKECQSGPEIKENLLSMLGGGKALRARQKFIKQNGNKLRIDFIQLRNSSLPLGTQVSLTLNEN